MKGIITQIQRFSVHDGPGIRTTVFMKGCNLRCIWCHNPETYLSEIQLQHFDSRCSLCGRCAKVCPAEARKITDGHMEYNKNKCLMCKICDEICVNSAIEICGTEYSSDELCDILIKDIKFYEKSGGGVTFSGGEPLLQPDFVFECVKILKENGISCAVETALNVPQETVIRAAEFFDLFMCDIKAIDDNLHKNLTSVSNKRILENIRLLAKLKSNILLRMPVAMGLNGTDKNITDTAGFMKEVGLSDIELLKLHKLAKHKYDSLNLPFTFPDVPETTDEDIERFYKLIKEGLYE